MQKQWYELNTGIEMTASVVGKQEHEGPLGAFFDMYDETDSFGKKTWEQAESELQRRAFSTLLLKSGYREEDIDALLAGDLLNQCAASAYGLRFFGIPYFGLYGACSTSVEGLLLGSLLHSGKMVKRCATVSSSHNCSAEKQYRFPLEYGAQRTPTAQWTVTGAGAFLLGDKGKARIRRACPGIVIDMGINDPNNMGAAMAPAALDTLCRFFRGTDTKPSDYDKIFTGDLGAEGSRLLSDLITAEGFDLGDNYSDCGMLIYYNKAQDKHAGGSGCGCAASVTAAHLVPKVQSGEWKRILVVATGAMMSPTSVMQGESIPAVAHLVEIRYEEEH